MSPQLSSLSQPSSVQSSLSSVCSSAAATFASFSISLLVSTVLEAAAAPLPGCTLGNVPIFDDPIVEEKF